MRMIAISSISEWYAKEKRTRNSRAYNCRTVLACGGHETQALTTAGPYLRVEESHKLHLLVAVPNTPLHPQHAHCVGGPSRANRFAHDAQAV